jgi:hypothetical protein
VNATVINSAFVPVPVKLLIDVGNSDDLFFQDVSNKIKVPTNNFDDYLGKGFSGDVIGKRARIKGFNLRF